MIGLGIAANEDAEMDTRAVVEHHLAAARAADLEAALVADYTEESVLIMPGNVLRGLEALRDFFGAAMQRELRPGSSQVTIDTMDIVGDYALLTWRTRFEGGEISFAADSYHVRDGKIVMQTSGFVAEGL